MKNNLTKPQILIGIDAGSTHLKTALYHLDGKRIDVRRRRVRVFHSGPGYSEYDAKEIFSQLCSCLAELRIQEYEPIAIGISSFGESIVPVDEHGTPLDRMIAWYDMRGQALIDTLSQRYGPAKLYSLTGQFPSGKFTLAKLLWLKEHNPGLLRRTHCFLFMQDYLAFCLTGNLCTEYSLASRSMLFHTSRLAWSEELLRICGIQRSQLPTVIPSGSSAGAVTKEAAEAAGLLPNIPVILAGHDHASASIAAGITEPAWILDSMGTSETSVFTASAIKKQDLLTHAIGSYPYYQDLFRCISSIQSCGASIEWIAGLLFDKDIYEHFFADAKQFMHKETDAPLFLPYLRGVQEAPGVSASFSGLRDIHGREALCYSVLEGLCFEYKRRLQSAQSCTGSAFLTVRAAGRLSREAVFMQLKADILGKPVEIIAEPEAVSQGAAILAGRYCGCITDWNPGISAVYLPGERSHFLRSRYLRYQERVAETLCSDAAGR